ncbi:inhibin beta chain [Nilaparvata lugens]|uniref:inhibin beta chain n=1 Tax=Nilaparvata lugens TaxID=108931 RepID=UPI00193D97AA|nr:inhibin beta chain [Nilaparvata lugens]
MRLMPLLVVLLCVRALVPPTGSHLAALAAAQDDPQLLQLEHSQPSQLERAPHSSLLDDVPSTARHRTPLPKKKKKRIVWRNGGTVCPNCVSHHHHAHHHHHHGHPRGGSGGGGGGAAPGGSNSSQQDKDSLRLEAIKHQILSKLGLASKPNITSAVSKDVVLKTIRRAQEMSAATLDGGDAGDMQAGGGGGGSVAAGGGSVDAESDDYFGRTSEIIAFAEPGHMLNGQQLLEFAPPQGVEGPELRVKSATLWVRLEPSSSLSAERLGRLRDRNLTLWIFRVSPHRLANTTHLSGKDFDEHTEVSASLSVPMSALGWQKFEVTSTVASWYAHGLRDRLRLLVDCSGCQQLVVAQGQGAHSSQERPFLVVHTEPTVARRVRRRALECSGSVKQCCKQRFFVSFKQLGWEDWIIAPSGYFANYCKGDCGGLHRTPDTYLNYYTHVIEEYRKLDKMSGIQPCCAPLKFSPMSLIYFGPDSNIIKRDLPKMVVDECGCP